MDSRDNERLTRVGPGTPMGALLRRYWWPVWFSEHVTTLPVPIRLLGEDLVLFRTPDGVLGILDRYCPHRSASLEFGRVEDGGIRCCYHGWKFAANGQCTDQPLEPEKSTLKDEVRARAGRVTEVSGLVFAYLGPDPAPDLPRYDLLFRNPGVAVVGADEEHCNWLQRAENTVDQAHVTVLHATGYPDMALKRPQVDWEETWYGMRVATSVSGRTKPKISHFIFPTSNRFSNARVGETPSQRMRIRVPVDDTETLTFYVNAFPGLQEEPRLRTEGVQKAERGVFERIDDGWWGIPSHEQDRIAQESQGVIADRSREFLGTSDRGVVLYRRMLQDALEAVEQGEDPKGVVRGRNADGAIVDFDASQDELAALTE